MFYYLIIAFQAFCIFHVYKSRNEYYWYFVIFFVPLIGAVVYFFTQIINKTNIKNAANKINSVINPGKKIRDLEKKLSFSNTFQNLINLADAYEENKNYEKAILYYEKALIGNFKKHPHTLNKAAKCYFEIKNYDKVVEYASELNLEKSFRNSIYIYAISLEKCGNLDEAEIQFRKTAVRYSNYGERLELSKFLIRRDKKEDAKIVLNEIVGEINNMIETNKRKYRFIYQESNKLLSKI
jgi:hypothetical protein